LRIGADLSDLAVDNLSRPLDQGTLVLAFLGGDCAECVGVLPSLNAIARSTGGPPVVGLFAGDRTGAQDWIFTNVPEFEVGDAPTSVLRRYFRRLPRMALVQDGIVRQVWNRPPTLEALRAAVALL